MKQNVGEHWVYRGIRYGQTAARYYKRMRPIWGGGGRSGWHGPPKRRRVGSEALRKVNKLLSERETKTVEVTTTNTITASGAAIIANVFAIIVGDNQADRTGVKITVQSVSSRHRVVINAAEVNGAIVRFILLYDRHPHGALPTVLEVLSIDATEALYQSANKSVAGRFQILHDETWTFDETQFHGMTKTFTKKPLRMNFNTSGSGIGDIEHGSFISFWMGDNLSQTVTTASQYVFKFTDS